MPAENLISYKILDIAMLTMYSFILRIK